MLDTIFGVEKFVNEIIWKRSYGHGDSRKSIGRSHDILFFYAKSGSYKLNRFFHAHDPKYLENFFRHHDERGRYKLENLTSPNPRPNLVYEYKGYPSPIKGWRVNLARMEQLDKENRLHFPAKEKGRIMKKVYLNELEGQPMTDVWTDIHPLSAHDQERLGYPTQKPLALLERIIQASTNPDDTVLDPFCGCGTTIAAAQKLGRRWLGIDITYLSISLQKYRLKAAFAIEPGKGYQVVGEPVDIHSARQLSIDDRYQFQWWALSLVQARPLGGDSGSKQGKKGADKGIDGVINFIDGAKGEARRVLVQVKSGTVSSRDIRDLVGTVDREKAAIGVFITLDTASRPMITEATSAGFYRSPLWGRDYPKIQIFTIATLLDGAKVNMPQSYGTFQQAPKEKKTDAAQSTLFE